MLLLRQGRYPEAIASLGEYARMAPEDLRGAYNLGLAHLRLGHFDEAIANLQRVSKKDPNHQRAHYYLGVALDRKGLKHEARLAYRAADQLDRGGTPYR